MTIRSFVKISILMVAFCAIASASPRIGRVVRGVPIAARKTALDPSVRDLKWFNIETEHFQIYFQEGLDRLASTVAQAAEDAYGPITELYDYRPDGKTTIIVRDHGDIANGFAAYFQNRIEVWASDLDYEFRSTHDWIWDVTTHEFTHIIQLGKSQKLGDVLPQIYFQYFRLEPESRTDVAEGLPNSIVSYALPTVTIPMWFAEGTAQFQSPRHRHDWWDPHREMVLRTAILNDKQLSYKRMGGFYDTDGRESEMVYDHGFSLVRYISNTYGDSTLRLVTRDISRIDHWSFDGSLKRVTGKSGSEIYDDWLNQERDRYRKDVATRGAGPAGDLMDKPGATLKATHGDVPVDVRPGVRRRSLRGHRTNFGHSSRASYYCGDPAWSPDGTRIAYVSNSGHDYHLASVLVRNTDDEDEELVHVPSSYRASSSVSWFPDGNRLVFSVRHQDHSNDWYYNDLVVADLEEEKTYGLTDGLRAAYPTVSPDGKRIAFVRNARGSKNLMLLDLDGLDFTDKKALPVDSTRLRRLTSWSDGTQFFRPRWSPDGTRLVVSIARRANRDIAVYRIPAKGQARLERTFASKGDDRDPVWSHDGRRIVFTSSADGIFNLYEAHLASGQVKRVTNVSGGAFMADVRADGAIAYSSYEPEGYRIRVIKPDAKRVPVSRRIFARNTPTTGSLASRTLTSTRIDRTIPRLMAPAVFPRFGIYDNKFRLGAYGMTGDRWDDVLLLSGFWVAPTTKDYDAFVLFEERHLLPFPLTLDFMRKVLHTDQDTVFSHRLSIDQITYGLNSMQISVQPRIKDWRLDIHSMYQLYDAEVGQTLSYEDAFGRWIVTDQGYNYTYYRGVSLGAAFSYPALKPFTTRDIGPQGWRVRLTYDRWWNWFFDEFDTGSGLLTEDYKPYHYNRFGLDGGLYVPMPWHDEHTLGFEGGASLIDAKVDSFFYEGIGGIIGLRGYTYYQLQGPRTLWMRGLYRLPVPGLGKMNTEVGPFYLDKTYIALFAEAGRVWRDDYTNSWTRGFKRDIGVELRLDMFSFYGFPSRVSFSAVHALDPQPGTDKNKFYLTVLFGYL